jgi:hypothetical protein
MGASIDQPSDHHSEKAEEHDHAASREAGDVWANPT